MPPDPSPSLAAHRAPGDVRSATSDGLVALLKEYYGRGPDEAKTYVTDDLVVCLLRGGFTRVEPSRRCSTAVTAATSSASAWPSKTSCANASRKSSKRQDPDMICEVFVLAANDVLG